MTKFIVGLLAGVALSQLAVALDASDARSQQKGVPCWSVPNGDASTIQCANGFWRTIMPDGTVSEGNGTFDPNAGIAGSRIITNPATQWPTGSVIPPEQSSSPAPGQWWYGSPIPSK